MLYCNACFLVCVSYCKESEGRHLKSCVFQALLFPERRAPCKRGLFSKFIQEWVAGNVLSSPAVLSQLRQHLQSRYCTSLKTSTLMGEMGVWSSGLVNWCSVSGTLRAQCFQTFESERLEVESGLGFLVCRHPHHSRSYYVVLAARFSHSPAWPVSVYDSLWLYLIT